MSSYVDKSNADDEELYVNTYANSEAKNFLPLFDCPDESINAVYYFRWWTFRKHIVKTPNGFVVTEFLPKVSWGSEYNTISCPAGLHIREGRWLKDGNIIADYEAIAKIAKLIGEDDDAKLYAQKAKRQKSNAKRKNRKGWNRVEINLQKGRLFVRAFHRKM